VDVRRALGAIVLMAAPIVSALGSASAGQDCATYSVTAPVLGTRTGTRCTTNLPPQLAQPITHQECGGVPPAKTTFCVTVTVYVP